MTRYFFELLLNRISGDKLGTFLKDSDPLFFDMLFFDYWLRHYSFRPCPDSVKLIKLPPDNISRGFYRKALDRFNGFGSFLLKTNPLLFELSFYDFWLRHTPEKIRRASVIKVRKYLNDPVIMKSKFASKCKRCGLPIGKDEEIIYFPIGKQAFHHACGLEDYNHFQASAMDEEIYNQRY